METKYFKLFGQKTEGKLILVAVVDEDFLGKDIPNQFECQSMKLPATIYTGTYPTLKVNTDTIKDVGAEMKGMGIDGVITTMDWYCVTRTQMDTFGISTKG